MKWDIYKAKAWMVQAGMNHIADGLFAEGGELIYEAKWGDGCENELSFRKTMLRICWWGNDLIDDAIKEFLK